MKITKLLILTCILSLNTVYAQENSANDASHPTLEIAYFGEKPPGLIPKLFAPDIVSPEGLFEGGKFSPDMKKYYFSRKKGKEINTGTWIARPNIALDEYYLIWDVARVTSLVIL